MKKRKRDLQVHRQTSGKEKQDTQTNREHSRKGARRKTNAQLDGKMEAKEKDRCPQRREREEEKKNDEIQADYRNAK